MLAIVGGKGPCVGVFSPSYVYGKKEDKVVCYHQTRLSSPLSLSPVSFRTCPLAPTIGIIEPLNWHYSRLTITEQLLAKDHLAFSPLYQGYSHGFLRASIICRAAYWALFLTIGAAF